MRRLMRGFLHFLWEFFIGDTPELTVGALIIVGLVSLISLNAHQPGLAAFMLPVLVVCLLGVSLRKS